MKSECTPLATPFSLRNSGRTPGSQTATDYFDFGPEQVSLQLEDKGVAEHCSTTTSWLECLPTEVISLILEIGYMDGPGIKLTDEDFRSVASSVSSRIRSVVLHTASLWSVVQASPGNLNKVLETLPLTLSRSRDYPLQIVLDCFWTKEKTDTLLGHLLPHHKRWQNLLITVTDEHFLDALRGVPMPALENLQIFHYSSTRRIALSPSLFAGTLPKLTHLHLRNVDFDTLPFSPHAIESLTVRGFGAWPRFPRLNDVLERCHSLKQFTIHVKPGVALEQLFPESDLEHITTRPITIPNLEDFSVFTSEWLSRDLASFIRLFASPNLRRLAVLDNTASSETTTVMEYRYPSPHQPDSIWSVFSANLYTSWTAFQPSRPITRLEIRNAFWPELWQGSKIFSSLGQLRELVLLDLKPNDVMRQLFPDDQAPGLVPIDAKGSFLLPSLVNLRIELEKPSTNHFMSASPAKTIALLNLFAMPNLAHLSLRHFDAEAWLGVSDHFRERQTEYRALESLLLEDMTGIPYAEPATIPSTCFPYLRSIDLRKVSANQFLLDLGAPSNWPTLAQLSIRGDPNLSKPLLHRTLLARKQAGIPLPTLRVDYHFQRNEESWLFIQEHVQNLELLENEGDARF